MVMGAASGVRSLNQYLELSQIQSSASYQQVAAIVRQQQIDLRLSPAILQVPLAPDLHGVMRVFNQQYLNKDALADVVIPSGSPVFNVYPTMEDFNNELRGVLSTQPELSVRMGEVKALDLVRAWAVGHESGHLIEGLALGAQTLNKKSPWQSTDKEKSLTLQGEIKGDVISLLLLTDGKQLNPDDALLFYDAIIQTRERLARTKNDLDHDTSKALRFFRPYFLEHVSQLSTITTPEDRERFALNTAIKVSDGNERQLTETAFKGRLSQLGLSHDFGGIAVYPSKGNDFSSYNSPSLYVNNKTKDAKSIPFFGVPHSAADVQFFLSEQIYPESPLVGVAGLEQAKEWMLDAVVTHEAGHMAYGRKYGRSVSPAFVKVLETHKPDALPDYHEMMADVFAVLLVSNRRQLNAEQSMALLDSIALRRRNNNLDYQHQSGIVLSLLRPQLQDLLQLMQVRPIKDNQVDFALQQAILLADTAVVQLAATIPSNVDKPTSRVIAGAAYP
jgi:hypothetical protein